MPDDLFGWRGTDIVLLGDREGGAWILARGWLGEGALTDIRRWRFAEPVAFARQVRRLVLEATGDAVAAQGQGAEALSWATARTL